MIRQFSQITGHSSPYTNRWFKPLVVLVLIALVLPALAGRIAYAQNKSHAEATSRLFESIAENNLQGVKINLIGGADLNARNLRNMTAIEMAIDKGYSDIVFYLMAYRDASNKAKLSRTSPPSARRVNPALPQSGETQSAVAGVYTPPPGASPWSATVVTSEPSAPEPNFQGPNPFEPGSRAPGSGLKIIGNIRGPSGPEPTAPTEQTVLSKIEPEDAPRSGAIEHPDVTMAAIAGPDPTVPVRRVPAVKIPAPIPNPKPATQPHPVHASAPVNPPSLTIAPLDKPLPPTARQVPVQDTPTLPMDTVLTAVTASKHDESLKSPLFDDEISALAPEAAPVVRAVQQTARPAAVELVSNALIPTKPVQELQAGAEPAHQQPPPKRKLAPVRTTLPGKPKDERGFFDKVLQALSFGEDEASSKQIAKNRVVMDMPPPLKPNEEPDQIIDDTGGWEVKQVEKASPAPLIKNAARPIPDKTDIQAVLPLTNINLSLLNDHRLGLPAPKTTSADFKESCIEKKSGSLVFCIIDLQWPADVANLFAASTILYEGTKAIVRYDEGAATYYHTLFPSQSYREIVDYYTARYGPPTKTVDRSIAPLASPRLSNPTVIWHSIAPVTKLLTTLEIRTFDDTRGSFPDTRRGVAVLYHEWSRPVFPHVSTVELMMLSASKRR